MRQKMQRENLVQCWMSEHEHAALRILSQSEHTTISETIRRLIRDRSREIGQWPVQIPADGVPAQVTQ